MVCVRGALSGGVRVARDLMRWIFNMVCVRESVERCCAGGDVIKWGRAPNRSFADISLILRTARLL